MKERHVQAALAAAERDLEQAARVRRRDYLGAGLGDPRDLPLQELARHLGLEQIVDAGAAAAEIAVAELHELEPGDAREELARLLAHALAVGEMAGIVVGHR